MMDALTFACPKCARRMTVGADFAGKPVRCPQCREVVAAPRDADVIAAPQERPESIFAEPGEEDSLFESGQVNRVELPPVPVPPPPEVPATPAAPWEALSDMPGNAVVKTPRPLSGPHPVAVAPPPFADAPAAPRWNWLLVAVSVYAAAATAVAAWGWLRPAGSATPAGQATTKQPAR